MKRSYEDEIESGNASNKQLKQSSILDQIVINPGLQHIIEMIFFNLDYKDLKNCKLVNAAINTILINPIFWLKKWSFNRGLSKKNQSEWIKALELTKNTNFERNVGLYIKKVIKIGHFVDIPCYINNDTLMKANEMSFGEALVKKDAGVLQILAPVTGIVNAPNATLQRILRYNILKANENIKMHIDLIKVLAPMMKNPNAPFNQQLQFKGVTTIYFAAHIGDIDVIKFLAPLSDNINEPNLAGITPIHNAAQEGHLDIIKFLVPLTENPNLPSDAGFTPITLASRRERSSKSYEYDKIIQILQS